MHAWQCKKLLLNSTSTIIDEAVTLALFVCQLSLKGLAHESILVDARLVIVKGVEASVILLNDNGLATAFTAFLIRQNFPQEPPAPTSLSMQF